MPDHPTTRRSLVLLTGALATALLAVAISASAASLSLSHVPIDLPGAPAALVPADLDGDGTLDLVIAVAYTEWNEIGITESSEIDAIEGLVEVMTVVPALLDHRELRAYRGLPEGGYEPFGPALEIGPEVLALLPGAPPAPVLALTDEGVSAVLLTPAAANAEPGQAAAPPPAGEPAPALRLEPLIADPPVLAGSGTFLSELDLARDLDGDGRLDLLLPAADGLAVYLATEDGLAPQPVARVSLPADEREARERLARHYPLPRIEDVTGDGVPDLIAQHYRQGWGRFWVTPGLGDGRFGAPLGPLGDPQAGPDEERVPETLFFGDLDGDGLAEHALAEELTTEDAGMRQELREAKEPPFRWWLYHSGPGLARVAEPYRSFEAVGYAETSDEDDDDGIQLPAGFQDVDGDGRSDLVTMTLDFSLLQAVRVLTVRSISIGLDFHIWCQESDGGFRRVEGLDLSGKFKLRLDDLRLGRLPQLGGDFDGDGRADFIQLGRGREVTVHLGRPGCFYPTSPDVRLRLAEAPKDLGLVRVRDLDGDGRSDLAIVQPRKVRSAGETAPVRLDLYFARGPRSGEGGR